MADSAQLKGVLPPPSRLQMNEEWSMLGPLTTCFAFTSMNILLCVDCLKVGCCRPCCHQPPKRSWNRQYELLVRVLRDFNVVVGAIRSWNGLRLFYDSSALLNPTWSPMLPSGLSSKLGDELETGFRFSYEFIYPTKAGAPNFDLKDPRKFILYFHGGSFCFMNRATHRLLLYLMAKETGKTILSIDYRRAPEFSYPVPHLDCFDAYKWLLKNLGNDSSKIFIAGDSAGGALTIDVIREARDNGVPLPAAAILISPWVDYFDNTSASLTENVDLDFLDPQVQRSLAGSYVDKARALEVCPIHQNLKGFPPLLIEYGECEIFRDQILAFATKAEKQGVYVECNGYADMVHDFQMLAISGMEPCFESLRSIRDFMDRASSSPPLQSLAHSNPSIPDFAHRPFKDECESDEGLPASGVTSSEGKDGGTEHDSTPSAFASASASDNISTLLGGGSADMEALDGELSSGAGGAGGTRLRVRRDRN